jgi:multidrug efflux pump subunit AcrA (membrane-fusion protein)
MQKLSREINVYELKSDKMENAKYHPQFLATGRINSVSTRVGDEVKKGQVLAMLDPENTLGSLTQAKAAYASALANYNKLVKGATNEDVAVTSAAYETAKTNLAHSKEVLVQAINNSFVTSVNTTNNINQFFDNPYGNFPQLYWTE